MTRLTGSSFAPDMRSAQFEIDLARTESARVRQARDESSARNAQAIVHFAAQGIAFRQSSYSQDYKDQMVRTVDSNGDQLISQAELAAQAGDAASPESVSKLYAALDQNGDGSLSARELNDSLPDIGRLPSFQNRLMALAGHGNAQPAAIGALYHDMCTRYDAATILGGLAQRTELSA